MTVLPVDLPTCVCPICALHCDDLDPAKLSSGATSCTLANASIARLRRVSRQTATDWDTCQRWMTDASQIVMTGHVIDLETSRAVAELVRETGARWLPDPAQRAASEAFAREGYFATTLGELPVREASVLVIGDVAKRWPRLDETLTRLNAVIHLPDTPELLDTLAAVRLVVSGKTLPTAFPKATLDLANWIQSATYLVVLVSPENALTSASPLLWSTLVGLVADLNKKQRAAFLQFDSASTLRSVLGSRIDPPAWSYEPVSPDAVRLVFCPFGHPSESVSQRTLFIGCLDRPLQPNERLIEAQVPGLDHPGIVIRGDGSVSLPLQACEPKQSSGLPTPAEAIRQLVTAGQKAPPQTSFA